MPIEVGIELRRPTFEEFKAIAYEVMAQAFEVHNTLGRLFREIAYKRLVARNLSNVDLEVPVKVSQGDFCKTYRLDMVVERAAIFEWKATADISAKHRSQLLNYLLLADLPRGKLVNGGRDLVQHEFVNTTLTRSDRLRFRVDLTDFHPLGVADRQWQLALVAAVRDWGAGLDVDLYEEYIAHVCGGDAVVNRVKDLVIDGHSCGYHTIRTSRTGAAFRVTAFANDDSEFVHHASRFLKWAKLPALHWINVRRAEITFRTLLPTRHIA